MQWLGGFIDNGASGPVFGPFSSASFSGGGCANGVRPYGLLPLLESYSRISPWLQALRVAPSPSLTLRVRRPQSSRR
jgi:hypothetical protein